MLTINAYAKINFFLKVLGKRPDGYHQIESLMLPVGLSDRLELEPADSGISLWCDRNDLGAVEQNLAYRAAVLLQSEAGCAKGVSIRLYKNIPAAAGLGGGSSDAAAVLTGLNQMWNLGLDTPGLLKLAGRLGSDVPFFILSRPAIAQGRGEILMKAYFPPLDLVLVNPGFGVSTAEAYRRLNFGLTMLPTCTKIPPLDYRNVGLAGLLSLMSNSFENVVIPQYPAIGQIKQKLIDCGACGALMSGSGSTVFGVFARTEDADAAYRKLMAHLPQTYRVVLTKTLP